MPSDPLVLGFDTSAAHCAAALLCGDHVIASTAQDMARGQAEHLMPLILGLLADADFALSDLDAIGVGIGPGNFTGIRISVSAARGLALALDCPAIGVSTFDATRLHDAQQSVIVPAPRDQVYLSQPGLPTPTLIPQDDIANIEVMAPPSAQVLAENIARMASQHLGQNTPLPAPLYIKPADAAPARDLPPVILP